MGRLKRERPKFLWLDPETGLKPRVPRATGESMLIGNASQDKDGSKWKHYHARKDGKTPVLQQNVEPSRAEQVVLFTPRYKSYLEPASTMGGGRSDMRAGVPEDECVDSQLEHAYPNDPKDGRSRASPTTRRSCATQIEWSSQKPVALEPWMTANALALTPPGLTFRSGNSDPFASTAFVVTKEVNRILMFMRDAILPAIYSTTILRQYSGDNSPIIDFSTGPQIISFQAAYGDWVQQFSCLYDEGMALAGLSAWSHLLPIQTKDQQLLNHYSMRARSCALLAERLGFEQDLRLLSKETVLHIFWLFRSEAISGDANAARTHGEKLRTIIRHAYSNGTIGMQSLLQFLFVDVDLALKNMDRTLFDVEWFAEVLEPLWQKARLVLSPSPEVSSGLSNVVEIQMLVGLIAEYGVNGPSLIVDSAIS
jgi:hypothetical protein